MSDIDINSILKQKGMSILFLHRNFPAQYRHILMELIKNPLNFLLFATNNQIADLPGVNRLSYPIAQRPEKSCHEYLKTYEESILHGQGAANMAFSLKKRGIKPDVICGHSWGPPMFMKDIYPDVPLLCYFEWFNSAEGADLDFDGRILTPSQRAHARCNNSLLLPDLESCDIGICPTEWQKSRFPEVYHDKIKVIHDGVNAEICQPNENAVFKIEQDDKTWEFTPNDDVVTFTTRGMDLYRGFPQFMEAVAILQEKRPDTHFIIAGDDIVCYGQKSTKGSYKKEMLEKHNYDFERLHFVGTLPITKYANLLQITSAHVYLTYPFVLSWSLMEAMSTACPIIASNTPPVREMIQDNYNGILFDFFNIEELVEKIEFALDNRDKMKPLRENARKTILDKYDVKNLVPKQIELIRSLIKK